MRQYINKLWHKLKQERLLAWHIAKSILHVSILDIKIHFLSQCTLDNESAATVRVVTDFALLRTWIKLVIENKVDKSVICF